MQTMNVKAEVTVLGNPTAMDDCSLMITKCDDGGTNHIHIVFSDNMILQVDMKITNAQIEQIGSILAQFALASRAISN